MAIKYYDADNPFVFDFSKGLNWVRIKPTYVGIEELNRTIDMLNKNKELSQIDFTPIFRKMGYFNKMPVRLQTISIMREEYPDSTLDELSAFSDNYFGKTLTKSGVSHCLRSLMQFYYELASKNSVTKNQSEKNNE